MKPPRFLTSPLAATVGVLAGLGMMVIPLRQLTSAPPMPTVKPPAVSATTVVPAWLTLKLLAPAKSVMLKTAAGQVLWALAETPVGDVESQAGLPLDQGGLDLMLTVVFHEASSETAVFLTLAPDGLEEQTRHAIGSGRIEEPLRFTWSTH